MEPTNLEDRDIEVRQGASGELPMILYLRGDEEVALEFNIGADEAMAALGIKRSRLTQISGRELRVGRMRDGRYVRPVYRKVDIEAYKSWTRPTASHKASKEARELTGEKISQEVRGHLDEAYLSLVKPLQRLHCTQETGAYEIKRHIENLATQLERLGDHLLSEQFHARQKLRHQMASIDLSFDAIKDLKIMDEALMIKLEGVQAEIKSLTTEVIALKEATDEVTGRISEHLDASVPRHIPSIKKRLGALRSANYR